jgi:surface carbohydrate biosynthesis protein
MKIIYLIVEIKDRELPAALALKDALLESGEFDYVVIMELRLFLKLADWKLLTTGVILFKSLPDSILSLIKKLVSRKFRITVHNQESISTLPSEVSAGLQIGIEASKYADKIFAASDEEYKQLAKITNSKKIVKTGFLRFIPSHIYYQNYFKNDIKYIQERYGNEYILFPTTIGNVFHDLDWPPKDETKIHHQTSESKITTTKNSINSIEVQLNEEVEIWKESQFNTFLELCSLIRLLQKGETMLVIRPHPAEPIGLPAYLFKHAKNVIISRERSIFPWIFCAKHVIVSTSTIAAEAKLFGIEPLILLPDIGSKGDVLDNLSINKFGNIYRNASDLFSYISEKELIQKKENNVEAIREKKSDFNYSFDPFVQSLESLAVESGGLFINKLILFKFVEFLFKLLKIFMPKREKYFAAKFTNLAIDLLSSAPNGLLYTSDKFAVFSKNSILKN